MESLLGFVAAFLQMHPYIIATLAVLCAVTSPLAVLHLLRILLLQFSNTVFYLLKLMCFLVDCVSTFRSSNEVTEPIASLYSEGLFFHN